MLSSCGGEHRLVVEGVKSAVYGVEVLGSHSCPSLPYHTP